MKKDQQLVLVIDFGGQYNQLIARRVREIGFYSELIPYTKAAAEIADRQPAAVILTGGPSSTMSEDAPRLSDEVFRAGIPILGICYGAQLMCHTFGGQLEKPAKREYGKTEISYGDSALFTDLPKEALCWMSHTDQIAQLPDGFTATAKTVDCPVAAFEDPARHLYGLQFHPEVVHTQGGTQIISNFLLKCVGLTPDWTPAGFIDYQVDAIRQTVGDQKVICALSGGVDSSVAAVLIHRAVGDQLTCIFCDHGLMRKDEGDMVESVFKEHFHMNFIRVNAEDRFLGKLQGVTDPERKRKIIGEEFIRVFEEEAAKIGQIDYLGQGTIYPDIIESGGGTNTAVIKSHHNVGGLPEDMTLKVLEPLRELFKDEVRQVGLELGIDPALIWRHPFPGPGLGIRVLGEVTKEKCDILREADAIYREELDKAGLTREIWQAFATLPDVRTVGVMGDERTYSHMIGLRAITSTDAMTAEYYPIPHELLDKIARRIVNEVQSVNRVVFDITGKPPATIEWE